MSKKALVIGLVTGLLLGIVGVGYLANQYVQIKLNQNNKVGVNEKVKIVTNEITEEEIINMLVNEEWVILSAKDNNSENDYLKYWGTSYSYGGGVCFDKEGNFEFTIGIFDGGVNPNSGKYKIDIHNNDIKYTFINGEEITCKYVMDNGVITQVKYVSRQDWNEDGDVLVTFRRKTEEEKAYEKVEESFYSKEWYPLTAMKDGKEFAISNVYKNAQDEKYYFYADITGFCRDLETIKQLEYGNKGFVTIDVDNKKLNFELVSSDILNHERIYYSTMYRTDENGNIVSFDFIENYGTSDEIIVTYGLAR